MSGLFSFLGLKTPGDALKELVTSPITGASVGVVHTIAKTTQEFLDLMKPIETMAVSRGYQRGIITSQVALETGYGKSVIGKNLFNIKATDSWLKAGKKTADVKTWESQGGRTVNIIAKFRDYDTFVDSANDYLSLISQASRYAQAWSNRGNYKKYFQELHKGGYATDPKYVTKLINTFESLGFN